MSLCLTDSAPCHEDVWGSRGVAPPFLTSTMHLGELSASCPGLLNPATYYVGGWWAPEPVLTLCRREESLDPAGNQTPAIQSVARRYADWAMPAHGV
jgi:hypothetical protein